MSAVREELANLYFERKIIKFGAFDLAAHADNPDLPQSPFYMHYPKRNEEGWEQARKVVSIAGQLVFNLIEEADLTDRRIVGIPNGGVPIGRLAAMQDTAYPWNFSEFFKRVTDGVKSFHPVEFPPYNGELLLGVDDHTSGGTTALQFQHALITGLGAGMTHLFNVVDRQQAGKQNLGSWGIVMKSVFTISELLAVGLAEGHIDQDKHDECLLFVRHNPIPRPKLLNATGGSIGSDKL